MVELSVLSVTFNSPDWLALLKASVEKYTPVKHEILIHDNGANNIGHARGLNALLKRATGKYVLVLDIDCHIQREWLTDMLSAYSSNPQTRLIAGAGVKMKPIRPAVMFFERQFALDNNWDFLQRRFEDVTFDVGIFIYFQTLYKGYNVEVLPCGNNVYTNTWSTQFILNSKPAFNHHWYGSRFVSNKSIDGRTYEDYIKSKTTYFKQVKKAGIIT